MEWEWILPSPADILVRSVLRRINKRRTRAVEKGALRWPKAPAHVQAVRVIREEHAADSWFCWQIELTYSYVGSGEYYSGNYVLPPDSEDEADEQAKHWTHKDVTVRYHPEKVSESVLLLKDQSS